MAVYLAIYGPKHANPIFWLGLIVWILGFVGNGKSKPKHLTASPLVRLSSCLATSEMEEELKEQFITMNI